MFPNNVRLGGRRTTGRQPLAVLRGPAEAVSQRRTTTQPDDPRDFCAALLSVRTYALPPEVDTLTWRVALRHFARTNPTDLEFRRLLERRAALPADRDAGGREHDDPDARHRRICRQVKDDPELSRRQLRGPRLLRPRP